jgi:gamma-glutamylaminecyclotransferase
MNETFLLFTYGTLMKGERNEHLLKDARFVGKATTKPTYKLFRIDGNFTFPAIIDTGDTAVKGEVYEVPASALPGMDRMEGHPHFYCRKPVELETALDKEVIAYFFVDKDSLPRRHPEIKSGDWLNR